MDDSITTPLSVRRWSRRLLVTAMGWALLTMLDRGQSSVLAQVVSAADFAAPNLTAPRPGSIAAAAAPMNNATQVILLVNPTTGNDAIADGSDRAPFKTITQALQVAQPGTVIRLAPGTYSQETGETFPLRLKPEVTVQGDAETRGQGIVIQGTGFFLSRTFARQNVAIVGADRAILSGVTVKNPDAQGYGVWIESTSPAILDSTFTESGHDGISVTGNGSPLVRNNYFYQNGANGITIYGTSQAEVRENVFEQTGFAINVNQRATPLLIGNRITQNKDGIVVQASAQPIVRDNSVDGNTRDGLVAIAQSRPNLGTAAAPGGNSFRNNGQFDVNAKGSSQAIAAFGNDWSKTIGTLDLTGATLEASAPSGVPMPWSSDAGSRSTVSSDQAMATNDKSTARGIQKRTAGSPSFSSPSTSASSIGSPSIGSLSIGSPSTRSPSIGATDAANVDTIPFGQRLISDRAVGANPQITPQAQQRPSAIGTNTAETNTAETNTATENGLSAASFPVPAAQSVQPPRRPVVSVVAIAPATRASSESMFPLPAALSGGVTQNLPPRAIQVMRVTVAAPTSLRSASSRAPVFTHRLPSPLPASLPFSLTAQPPVAQRTIPQQVSQQPLSQQVSQQASQQVMTPIAVASTPRAIVPVSRLLLRRPTPGVAPRTGTIEIPVPAPEARSTPSPIPVRAVVETPFSTSTISNTPSGTLASAGLLPVPNPNAPIGVVGSTPNIYHAQQTAATHAFAANSTTLGLRYRVVVDADDSQQAQLRATFPNAFRTSIRGRSLMQVGAFGDRTKADQLMQTLSSQGVQARVETME